MSLLCLVLPPFSALVRARLTFNGCHKSPSLKLIPALHFLALKIKLPPKGPLLGNRYLSQWDFQFQVTLFFGGMAPDPLRRRRARGEGEGEGTANVTDARRRFEPSQNLRPAGGIVGFWGYKGGWQGALGLRAGGGKGALGLRAGGGLGFREGPGGKWAGRSGAEGTNKRASEQCKHASD